VSLEQKAGKKAQKAGINIKISKINNFSYFKVFKFLFLVNFLFITMG
jgi:hypothetical protein